MGKTAQVLGGPVWLFVTFVVLLTIGLAAFVLFDSLRPRRRSGARGRLPEPLWLYTAIEAAFLGTLLLVQVIPGISLTSAIPVALAPFSLVASFAYLLRAVYPRPAGEQPDDASGDADSDDSREPAQTS